MVLKLDPATPNAYCHVGFAHYALGHDAEGRRYLNTCYQRPVTLKGLSEPLEIVTLGWR